MIKGLEETSNGQIKLPADLELLESEQVNKYLRETCEKFDVKCPPPQTTTRLLDKVQCWLACLVCDSSNLPLQIYVVYSVLV